MALARDARVAIRRGVKVLRPTPHAALPGRQDWTYMTKFSDLSLDPKVLKAIEDTGYETPTPIQAGAIPPALEGIGGSAGAHFP